MKLSMYMLEHWFSDRSSAANIQNGIRSITNARLFSEDIIFSADCVYVGRTVDFFPTSNSHEVMMMHKNDIISVTSTDLHAVFNEVLSIFDFYGEIEQQLFASIFKSSPEQAVLSACEQLMGPMFILSPDYRILACSQNFSDQYVNLFWETFANTKEATLDMVTKMKHSNINALMPSNPHMVSFTEPNAAPYSYGLANTYFSASGTVLGYFIAANNRPISRFERDMAQIILDALNLIQAGAIRPTEIDPRHTSDDALLSKLLSGTDPIRTEQYLSALHGLTPESHYCIAIASTANTQARAIIQKTFQKRFANCICSRTDKDITFLIWSKQPITPSQMAQMIDDTEENSDLRWGISNPFRHLQDASFFYEQAQFALSEKQEAVSLFSRCAIRFLLQTGATPAQKNARHPLVLELERKPEDSRKELLDTLREYLMCERSVKQASEHLFVHRNTVTYRIDLIKGMQLLDFENAYDRQYALISLL